MGVPRKVVQIATSRAADAGANLFALADDGTIWWQDPIVDPAWTPIAALPAAESCTATSHTGNKCRLVQGHRDNHWDGSRRWG
jgi:hypothetical protein